MLIRVPCDCGKVFLAAEKEAGKTMECPACRKELVVPQPPAREGRFWEQSHGLEPDPSSPMEQEYQRTRHADRPSGRLRVWGGVQIAVGAALILPGYLVFPGVDWLRAFSIITSIALLIKGCVEVATGKPVVETLYLANHPRSGMMLGLSVLTGFAILIGVVFAVERVLSFSLIGTNEVRIINPGPMNVEVRVRSGELGREFEVRPHDQASIYLPKGNYEIYFVYPNKPNALFQGNNISLGPNGIEITLEKVANGNYEIKEVTK
jgi:hypothetical protein